MWKALFVVLAAAVVLASCRAKDAADSTGVYNSPEAVHRAMCDAIQGNDWEKAAGCMDEDSQARLAHRLAFAISWLAKADDQKAMETLATKHGFKLREESDTSCSEVANKPAFIAELFSFAETHTPDDDFSELEKSLTGRLVDLKTAGDEATGVIEVEGKDRQRIEFRRIDGRWLVHFSEGKL